MISLRFFQLCWRVAARLASPRRLLILSVNMRFVVNSDEVSKSLILSILLRGLFRRATVFLGGGGGPSPSPRLPLSTVYSLMSSRTLLESVTKRGGGRSLEKARRRETNKDEGCWAPTVLEYLSSGCRGVYENGGGWIIPTRPPRTTRPVP